nr:reverse transcriptase domain-containing protein [Tanacetum cinerariifolium]
MMSSFLQMQQPSGSGSLPSNIVANPRGDLKAITTRSGVTYDRPTILPTPSPLPKEVERETEATRTRLNDQKLYEKANNQMMKFLQIFQRLHFDISFANALLHMPKFASTFKCLLINKEKLLKLASTPLNENCSVLLLKKLPEKRGDLGKFLIPCDFLKLEECLALADLGASIKSMPLSVWKKLSLLKLTSTRMTRELANRSVAIPVGVAEDVFVKVGNGNPTPSDPIIASFSLSFTPFEGSDFILEEIETFLRTPDELTNLDDDYYDTEGDIPYLEKLLNEDPSPNLPPMKNEYLKQVDVTMTKPSIEEPLELKLKD